MCWPCCAEPRNTERAAAPRPPARRNSASPSGAWCGLFAAETLGPGGPGWATLWEVLLCVTVLAFIIALIRLARGPTLADRVVALDLVSTIAVIAAALSSLAYSQPVFLDLAVVLTLVTFVATIAFAKSIWMAAKP